MVNADNFNFSDSSYSDKLFDEIDRLCRNLNHKLQKHSSTGSFFGQGKLLACLCVADGISQRDLSRSLELSPPTVAEMLDKLDAAGLIIKKKDKSDSRRILIYITSEGRLASDKMRDERSRCLAELFSSLSPSEASELMRLTSKLNTSFESPESLPASSLEPTVKSNPPGKIRRGVRLG